MSFIQMKKRTFEKNPEKNNVNILHKLTKIFITHNKNEKKGGA